MSDQNALVFANVIAHFHRKTLSFRTFFGPSKKTGLVCVEFFVQTNFNDMLRPEQRIVIGSISGDDIDKATAVSRIIGENVKQILRKTDSPDAEESQNFKFWQKVESNTVALTKKTGGMLCEREIDGVTVSFLPEWAWIVDLF